MANSANRISLANYLRGQQSSIYGKNYVLNESAFHNTKNVAVANSATVARNTTTPLTAISDFDIALPNNTNGYVEWTLGTVDNSLKNSNCQLSFHYTASSIGSAVKAEVYQNSVLVGATDVLATQTSAQPILLNVPCGDLTGATLIRVSNQTGNSGTSAIKLANLNYGRATNLKDISQAVFIGSAYYAGTASCEWSRNNTAIGAFNTTAACPAPTIDLNPGYNGGGIIQTTDADLPQFTVNNLPPGNYEVQLTAYVRDDNSTSSVISLAINDGTNTKGFITTRVDAATTSTRIPMVVTAFFNYTTTGNRTFALYGQSTGGTVRITNDSTTNGNRVNFIIKRFPSANEQAITLDQQGMFWNGIHDTDCTWTRTNTGYGDFAADSTCTFTEKQNNNFGAVTSYLSGSDKLPGIVFTPKKVGSYFVCALGSMEQSAAGSAVIRLTDGTNTIDEKGQAVTTRLHTPLCGIVRANSLAAITLRIEAKSGAGTVTYQSSGTGYAVSWTIFALDQAFPAPIIINSVRSSASGGVRIVSAIVDNTGTPTVRQQDGSWITSITDGGTGVNTLNIVAGTFTATPVCTCATESSITNQGMCGPDNPSTSSVQILTKTGANAAVDRAFHVVCVGAK